MDTALRSLKTDLLHLISKFNSGDFTGPDFPEIVSLVDTLAPLSPIADPNNHLPLVAGSWSTLYASFGTGHSKGKSHKDDSTLSLQTFKTFPNINIHVDAVIQEIGLASSAYNNVILFKTINENVDGEIIIHGKYDCDIENLKRFRVTFHAAEIRGRAGASNADLCGSLGFAGDDLLKREFKPAKFYSDIVYLDDYIRINIGGMGGVYVLERRSEPAISL